jgi:3'(2'), 5'-bisphosphate nucleotidase
VSPSAESDAELAGRLATEAGLMLVALRADLFGRHLPPWEVMDAGDAAAQRLIADALAVARPDDAVLSEEGLEDPRRFVHDRVWIVDPLDGTREYAEVGRVDWAVHIAVWDHGRFAAGAVALPAVGRTLTTDPPPPTPRPDRARPVVVSSRSRMTYVTQLVADALGAHIALLGSAGAKAMAVVGGEADVYVHAGGMYQWDSAAPAAVALAAGLHVSRVDGSPLVYNQPDPWLPDLFVCQPRLADRVLGALGARNHRPGPGDRSDSLDGLDRQ